MSTPTEKAVPFLALIASTMNLGQTHRGWFCPEVSWDSRVNLD